MYKTAILFIMIIYIKNNENKDWFSGKGKYD